MVRLWSDMVKLWSDVDRIGSDMVRLQVSKRAGRDTFGLAEVDSKTNNSVSAGDRTDKGG